MSLLLLLSVVFLLLFFLVTSPTCHCYSSSRSCFSRYSSSSHYRHVIATAPLGRVSLVILPRHITDMSLLQLLSVVFLSLFFLVTSPSCHCYCSSRSCFSRYSSSSHHRHVIATAPLGRVSLVILPRHITVCSRQFTGSGASHDQFHSLICFNAGLTSFCLLIVFLRSNENKVLLQFV